MSLIAQNITGILNELNANTKLIAVTKTKPLEDLLEAYQSGFKRFGENKVQEMTDKYERLPKDIEWHMIGHLQSNKVKYIAPYVYLIHGVDSFKLLKEINKEAIKNKRVINCLLQIYIAQEETKFGLSKEEAYELLTSEAFGQLDHIKIIGLMGMASNCDDTEKIRQEFRGLKTLFDSFRALESKSISMKELSMGMSGDYHLAMQEGSTMVRIGSAIFGSR
ncbi:Pyridoxal phosphate homeostasis protein [Dyadobacter sp. CECT 9275]|uniref:Pyridoxal phosphate homeostasis protein n=1 Tax=Dyadobacter helix TaxID=2822344 RepID=A0A916N538_9BACT|nr:YggS family pyridoxal phosphate-dependent enzyme [Dyadobacter sp. CECT 9275]CAG4994981.1 Pyridoxal phosphate homeostasis protein [Dyadobacter sp. CECT 9275]